MWSRSAICGRVAAGAGHLASDMVSFNVDPQDCSLLFSIYCRHEKSALIGGFPSADALATCAFNKVSLDSDWLALISALGFELCRLSDNWALVFESVKATSVIFFLGVGGFVCYKLYHYYWPKSPPDSPDPGSPSAKTKVFTSASTLGNFYNAKRQLLDPGDEAPFGSVHTQYFGPTPAYDESDYADRSNSTSVSEDSAEESLYAESSVSDHRQSLKRNRNNWRGVWGGRRSRQAHIREPPPATNSRGWLLSRIRGSVAPFSKPIVQKKGASWPVTPCKGVGQAQNLKKAQSFSECCERMAPDGAESSSLEGFPACEMAREISMDSLGFSDFSEAKRCPKFPREGSFDSTCSDLSIEWPVREHVDSATVACMEKLQQEIDQLKSNCLLMDEDFETIKCNRNVPGMSSLMTEAPHEESERRACFAGLYSLTCINKSISSELSDMALINLSQGIKQAEFDSPVISGPASIEIQKSPLQSLEQPLSLNSEVAFSEDELMAHLEWDNEEMIQPFPEDELEQTMRPELFGCVDTLEMDLETELSNMDPRFTPQSPDEHRSLLDSGPMALIQVEVKRPELQPLNLQPQNLLQWSSEESGFMEWDPTSDSQRTLNDSTSALSKSWLSNTVDSAESSEQVTPESDAYLTPFSELATPIENGPQVQNNIGNREQLLQYALREWHGNTPKAQRILKGYSEVPGALGLQDIRAIRGDNYCAIRAAVFQTLLMRLPVPNGDATYATLSQAICNGSLWIQDWQFAGRLPYKGSNVLHGIRQCLNSLDNLSSLLDEAPNRESLLVHMLNSDPSLDLHVLEAVKLHMLVSAMQLHSASSGSSCDLPLFAILMFARDTSETPRDLMNNHLQAVGNTGGLEQVEMFLLSHTLGVNIKVVRPNAFGTEDFVCNFSRDDGTECPSIALVAEDDRHYNVLL